VIDLRRLRDEPDYRAGAVKKGASAEAVDALLDADARRRIAMHEAETARAAQNAASKEIGRAAPDERPAKIEEASRLKAELERLEAAETAAQTDVDALILQIPNPAHLSVPEGGEEDFEVLREVGDRTPERPHDHAEIGELLGLVDSERAVRNSGSRFAYLMGPAVRLEFALVQWILELLDGHGFIPVVPPVLVREEMMVDAGSFPPIAIRCTRSTVTTSS
jgi:seryl-tRNA synthetase